MENQRIKTLASKNLKSKSSLRSKQNSKGTIVDGTPPPRSNSRSGGIKQSSNAERSGSRLRAQNQGSGSIKKLEGRKLGRIRQLDRNTADEATDRRKQDELRQQIAIKEQQLKEMTEAAQRLRGRIGSGTLPDVRAPNISNGGEKKSMKQSFGSFNLNERTAVHIDDIDTIPTRGHPSKSPAQHNLNQRFRATDFRKPQPLSSKSPSAGGGLRSQKFQQSKDNNEIRRDSHNSRHSGTSPLRTKTSGSRDREVKAAGNLKQPSNDTFKTFEQKVSYQAPLRQKSSISPLRASNSRSRSPQQVTFLGSKNNLSSLNSHQSSFNKIIKPVPVQIGQMSSQHSSALFARTEHLNSKCRDRIETLRIDNQALQHRFSLVQDELNNTIRERQSLWDKLEIMRREQLY